MCSGVTRQRSDSQSDCCFLEVYSWLSCQLPCLCHGHSFVKSWFPICVPCSYFCLSEAQTKLSGACACYLISWLEAVLGTEASVYGIWCYCQVDVRSEQLCTCCGVIVEETCFVKGGKDLVTVRLTSSYMFNTHKCQLQPLLPLSPPHSAWILPCIQVSTQQGAYWLGSVAHINNIKGGRLKRRQEEKCKDRLGYIAHLRQA
jgi:hypothetical protein